MYLSNPSSLISFLCSISVILRRLLKVWCIIVKTNGYVLRPNVLNFFSFSKEYRTLPYVH